MTPTDDGPEPRPSDTLQAVCHVCGHAKGRVLPFRYTFKGRFLYGIRCSTCSLVFIDPQPSADEIAGLYSEDYFTKCGETCGAHGRAAYMELARESEADRLHSAQRLDVLLRRQIGMRGRLLEIGCGPGFFLSAMRQLGWEVKGLEISAYAVGHAVETLGLDVIHGAIKPGVLPPGAFDAVFMGDVLEHLPNPRGALETIRMWLQTGGAVVIAVPSTMNLLSTKLGMPLYGA